MRKRFLSLVLAASMAAFTLSACGGGAADEAKEKVEDAKEDVKEDAEEVKEKVESATADDELVYWSMWSQDEPQAHVIQEAVNKYTEDTGMKVDLQFKGRNGQREGLQPALDAGQHIDLFDEDVNRVNGSWGNYILDLEDMAKTYEAEHGNKTLFAIARNAYGQTHDGDATLHSIPYQPSIFGMFYNKDLFDQAGIEEVPGTWEEFDKVCATLKENDITPITADDAYVTSLLGYHFGRHLTQDGVKALVGDPAIAAKVEAGEVEAVTWDDPRVLAAAKELEDFAKKGYFSESIETNKFPAAQNQEFGLGDAAMIPDGSWVPNEIKDIAGPDFNWGYFNYPSVPEGLNDNTANNIANQVFAINKESQLKDEAFKLIEYITTGEFDKLMTEEALSIPVDKANADAWPKVLTEVKPGFDATSTYYDWAVGIENNVDLTPVIQSQGTDLLAGNITAEEFVMNCKEAAGK